MNPINICFVTDDKYAPYTGVAMYSIIKHLPAGTPTHFYIFDNAITPQTKQKMEQLLPASSNISFVDVSSCLGTLQQLQQTAAHITKTSYLKFFIADLLPEVDKIIYLDGDLVITDDITALWNTPLEDKLLAAVEDVGYTYWCQHNPELKLKFKCMNSGVMLINCKKWRETNLSAQLLACAKEHDKVGFGQDQPVLNYVCKDQIVFLPFYWNVQDTFFRDEIEIVDRKDIAACHEAKNFPKIIHYTYVKKPWNYPFMRQADVFWKYYAASSLCSQALYSKYKKLLPLISSPAIAQKLRECEMNHVEGWAIKFILIIASLRIDERKAFLISYKHLVKIYYKR